MKERLIVRLSVIFLFFMHVFDAAVSVSPFISVTKALIETPAKFRIHPVHISLTQGPS